MHKLKYSVIRFRNVIMNPWHVAMIVLLTLHFTMLMLHFKPAISTPDANGYLAQARLIANQGHTWFEPESPLQFIGTHWLKAENGRYYNRYPPGLPTILAIPYKLAGPSAALLINPILTTLTLLGLFMLCSLWLGKIRLCCSTDNGAQPNYHSLYIKLFHNNGRLIIVMGWQFYSTPFLR